MIVAKCIQKHKNKSGKIISYTLMDKDGKTVSFNADILKDHIKNNRIDVVNLKLTVDERLIDKEVNEENTQLLADKQLEKLKSKAAILGLPIYEIDTMDNKKCLVIKQGENTYTFYIPNEVTQISDMEYASNTEILRKIQGDLTVIGGENLGSVDYLFQGLQVTNLNLSRFRPKLLTSVRGMFRDCNAYIIDISHIKISNNADREQMFSECKPSCLIKLSLEEYQKQFKLFEQDIWEHDLNIQIRVINEEYSEFKSINNKNQLIYSEKVKNTDLMRALVHLNDNIDYLCDCYSELIEEIEYIRPVVYFSYLKKENPLSIFLSNENNKTYYAKDLIDKDKAVEIINSEKVVCNNDNFIVITNIESKSFRFGVHNGKGDWISKGLETYSLILLINNNINKLKSLESVVEQDVAKIIENLTTLQSNHMDKIKKFGTIKLKAQNKGVKIDIDVRLHTNKLADKIYEFGYDLVKNYIKVEILFTSNGRDYKMFKVEDGTDTALDKFIYKIYELTKKSKNGAVIRLVTNDKNEINLEVVTE